MTNPYDTEEARQARLRQVEMGAPQPDTPNPVGASEPDDGIADLVAASEGNPGEVLDTLVTEFEKWVVLPDKACGWGMALFAAQSYIVDALDTVAYLYVSSPEPACGKSNVMFMLQSCVKNPELTSAPSAAGLSRSVVGHDGVRHTLIVDEVDGVFGPAAGEGAELMRVILNSGYRRATGTRTICEGPSNKVVTIDVFGVKVVGGIENVDHELPATLLTRCLVVPMRRATPEQLRALPRFRERLVDRAFDGHRVALQAAFGACADQIAEMEVKFPESMSGRQADLWEPLFQIADRCGGEWPDRARQAAEVMVLPGDDDVVSDGEQLIRDCWEVFRASDSDFLYSKDLADAVSVLDGSQWLSARGFALTVQRMAKLLRPYGITPEFDDTRDRRKGYYRAPFESAIATWCPDVELGGNLSEPLRETP